MTAGWDDLPDPMGTVPLFGDPDTGGADPTTGELPPLALPEVIHGRVVETPTSMMLSRTAASAIEDWRGTDVSKRAAEVGDQLVEHLRYWHAAARAARPEGRITNAVVTPELVWLAGAADTLGAIGGAFTRAHKEARDLAGEVVAEVRPDKADAGSATVKVAAGPASGGQVRVTRTQPTQVATNTDALVDLLPAWLVAEAYRQGAAVLPSDEVDEATVYAHGVRDGLALLLSLTSPPKWKSTALDALAVQMGNADETALTTRLAAAYGRVPHGEARTTIEHVPTEEKR